MGERQRTPSTGSLTLAYRWRRARAGYGRISEAVVAAALGVVLLALAQVFHLPDDGAASPSELVALLPASDASNRAAFPGFVFRERANPKRMWVGASHGAYMLGPNFLFPPDPSERAGAFGTDIGRASGGAQDQLIAKLQGEFDFDVGELEHEMRRSQAEAAEQVAEWYEPVARVRVTIRRTRVGVLTAWYVREPVRIEIEPMEGEIFTEADRVNAHERILRQLRIRCGFSQETDDAVTAGEAVTSFEPFGLRRDAGYLALSLAGITGMALACIVVRDGHRRRRALARGTSWPDLASVVGPEPLPAWWRFSRGRPWRLRDARWPVCLAVIAVVSAQLASMTEPAPAPPSSLAALLPADATESSIEFDGTLFRPDGGSGVWSGTSAREKRLSPEPLFTVYSTTLVDLDDETMASLMAYMQRSAAGFNPQLQVAIARVQVSLERQRIGLLAPWLVRERVRIAVDPLPDASCSDAEIVAARDEVIAQLDRKAELTASENTTITAGGALVSINWSGLAFDAWLALSAVLALMLLSASGFITFRAVGRAWSMRRGAEVVRPPCLWCGYELHGMPSTEHACPECGREQPAWTLARTDTEPKT